jgi:hypothetical protein
MEALLERLRARESKSRVEALTELVEGVTASRFDAAADLSALCGALAPCFADNNVQVAVRAASALEAIARAVPEGAMRPHADVLTPPLAELLGNAKVRFQPSRATAASQ